uniref:Uncharacterized protein n=1 Tax=Cucumis melo TaxID=3656 RepID=A0A9I9EFZ1_CUCME
MNNKRGDGGENLESKKKGHVEGRCVMEGVKIKHGYLRAQPWERKLVGNGLWDRSNWVGLGYNLQVG